VAVFQGAMEMFHRLLFMWLILPYTDSRGLLLPHFGVHCYFCSYLRDCLSLKEGWMIIVEKKITDQKMM
jgi:hypothetical protein